MVSTPLKNISQIGNLPQGWKIKHLWNHHPDNGSEWNCNGKLQLSEKVQFQKNNQHDASFWLPTFCNFAPPHVSTKTAREFYPNMPGGTSSLTLGLQQKQPTWSFITLRTFFYLFFRRKGSFIAAGFFGRKWFFVRRKYANLMWTTIRPLSWMKW